MASERFSKCAMRFTNCLSIVAALASCVAAFLGNTPNQVDSGAFINGPGATGSASGAAHSASGSVMDENIYRDFLTKAARLSEPSPWSSPSSAAANNKNVLNEEVPVPSLLTAWKQDSTLPNPLIADPEPFNVDTRSSTRLRFGKRTPPVGFTVRGTRLRFGKRADEADADAASQHYFQVGIAPSQNRIHIRGTRLRFGKRNGQRLRFGKRGRLVLVDNINNNDDGDSMPDFYYDHPVEKLSDDEYSALLGDLSASGNINNDDFTENNQNDVDEQQSKLLASHFDKRAPSSRLRFGKKSAAGIPVGMLGSEGSDKNNVRLRFGKRGGSLDGDDHAFFYGQPRLDVFKRPATRLRFGKRSVNDGEQAHHDDEDPLIETNQVNDHQEPAEASSNNNRSTNSQEVKTAILH